ncbi:phage tail tape measure protein [Vibrio hannami]|uniref:phage tail tape measure protein n=1 Tax=Vibrio hannami TaxID=2717094 RepID=UPI00241023FB|nr:phage tail tape measure protein [Vibrio hannami]MDG3089138.1 phage tail tape measure protein [Vibrio hannami]
MVNKVNVKFRAETKSAQEDIQKLSRQQQAFKGELVKVQGRAKEFNATLSDVRAYEQYQKRVGTIGEKLKTNKSRIDELNKVQKERGRLLKGEAKELEALKGKTATLVTEEKSLKNSLQGVSEKLRASGVNTNRLEDAKEALARRGSRLNKQLERENALLDRSNKLQKRKAELTSRAGEVAKVGAVGTLAAAGLSYKAASDNQYSFAEVQKTLEDGTTAKDARAIQLALEKVAMNTANMNIEDANRLAAGGSAGGVKNADLVNYVKNTGMIAAAWDMGADETAETTMAIQNSMALDSAGMMQLANEINLASNSFGTTADKVVQSVKRSGSMLVNNGFSQQQAVGIATALNTLGAAPEEAGTIMKNMVLNMTAGDTVSGQAADAFDKIELDPVEMAERMQKDAAGALREVFQRVQGLDEADRITTLKGIFGSEGLGKVQDLANRSDWLDEIYAKVGTSQGNEVSEEYKIIAQTQRAKDEEWTNSINQLASAFGETLMPVVDTVRPVLIEGTQALTSFLRENKNLASGAVVAAGAVGAVVAGMKAIKIAKGARDLIGMAREASELRKVSSARNSASRSSVGLVSRLRALDRQMSMTGRGGGFSSGGRSRKPGNRTRGAGSLSSGGKGGFGKMGMLGKAKGLVRRVPVLGAALGAADMASAAMDGDIASVVKSGASTIGGTLGAVLGSVVPGAGTLIGGVLGSMAGDLVGRLATASSFNFFNGDDETEQALSGAPLTDKVKEVEQAQALTARASQLPPIHISQTIDGSGKDADQVAVLSAEAIKQIILNVLDDRDSQFNRAQTYALGA